MEVRKRRGERCGSLICSMSLPCITSFFLLFLAFIGEGTVNVSALNYTSTRLITSFRLARIQSFLEKINKPAVRSIESPDGDIIDCVHRHKQPALDHSLLKNHKIQRVAPQMPAFRGGRQPRNYNASDAARRAWQTWHHVGHCPKGTVPIRRSSVDDVLRAKSLYHYGKKQQGVPLARKVDAPDVVSGNGHEHAIAYTGNTQEIYGAKATINVWDPSVQMSNEFSLSQIWILSGSFDGSDLNSIEAGWQGACSSHLQVDHLQTNNDFEDIMQAFSGTNAERRKVFFVYVSIAHLIMIANGSIFYKPHPCTPTTKKVKHIKNNKSG